MAIEHVCIHGYLLSIDAELVGSMDSGGVSSRADDARGTPTKSHTSPSIFVYEDKRDAFTVKQLNSL